MSFFKHDSAFVDEPCQIGDGTKIWHFCHIHVGAKIGENCSLGQNCNVGEGVVIGDNVRVQNNVSIYTGTTIENDVFLGPSCVLTNVSNPRAQIDRKHLYEKTLLRSGCSVGANATIVCGVTVGRYAFVAAGAVVTSDVADYAMVMGLPARQVGWVSRHGHPLREKGADGVMVCPESGLRYREETGRGLICLDLSEEEPLPSSMAKGSAAYADFHSPRSGSESEPRS